MRNSPEPEARSALLTLDWFPKPVRHSDSGVLGAVIKLVIGVAVGVLFFAIGWKILGTIVLILSALIGVISLASVRGRSGVSKFFAAVGVFLGHWITLIVLVPTYLIGFTIARAFGRLSGNDPLQMRDFDRSTFWVECDRDERKVRHIRSMFTTERPTRIGFRLVPALAVAAALLVAAEVTLRFMGFGDPIVYRMDPVIGYMPAPNQDVSRSGGRILINEFGMRSPPVTSPKPEDSLRVLMIGDSTLYGGSYIDHEELYSTKLMADLAARADGRKPEILSAGVNGWGPFHKLGYVDRFGAFDSDIAVICLPYQDIYRPLSGLEGKPFLPENARPKLALQEVFHHLLWRIQASTLGPPSAEAQEIQAPRGIDAYVQLATALRNAGAEVFVEVLPSKTAAETATVPEDEARRVAELTAALEKAGFSTGFPSGLFVNAKEKKPIYHDECHLHKDGHRLYAEHLADRIAEKSERFKQWSSRKNPNAEQGR